ncbi:hypothetical protein, partial [Actinoplanes sp. NPDC049802]|uniref:hypothetical protein n=1 Tax=Actinoplanes sp. NPDC049802 TaxID=3154742 RepID=UPI003404DA19
PAGAALAGRGRGLPAAQRGAPGGTDPRRDGAAVTTLLHAAEAWHTSTGVWPTITLDQLRQERPNLSGTQFQQALADAIPVNLHDEFNNALSQSDKND